MELNTKTYVWKIHYVLPTREIQNPNFPVNRFSSSDCWSPSTVCSFVFVSQSEVAGYSDLMMQCCSRVGRHSQPITVGVKLNSF